MAILDTARLVQNDSMLKFAAASHESDRFQYPAETPHLNPHALKILDKQDGKGRGVFTTQAMRTGCLLEISPVLLLSKEEYSRNGGVHETVLKDYVFSWDRKGQMAVALGIGSIFNHSRQPNVNFILNRQQKTISYTLAKNVVAGEELCIYYGSQAKFGSEAEFESEEETLDGFLEALSSVNLQDEVDPDLCELKSACDQDNDQDKTVEELDPDQIIPFSDCPHERVTSEISLADLPLELVDAWMIDVLAINVNELFDFIRQTRISFGWSGYYQTHLKRIKRLDADRLTVMLLPPDHIAPSETCQQFLDLISNHPVAITKPYQMNVPARAAATRDQLEVFTPIWPVVYIPIRFGSTSEIMPKGITRTHLEWIRTMIARVERVSLEAEKRGEFPIATIVAASTLGPPLAEASDTRRSTGNFLCHSIANVIDQVAALDVKGARQVEGQDPPYLLSGLTVFTTHEPCLMCSMALLHSRISAVYYIRKCPAAGGLGSVYSVHEDRGLNHKFQAWYWKGEKRNIATLELDP